MRLAFAILLITSAIAVVFAQAPKINTGLQVKSVSRQIDLISQLARHNVNFTLANTGSESADHFYIAWEEDAADHLSIQTVTSGSTKLNIGTRSELQHGKKEKDGSHIDYYLYRVGLPNTLASGASIDLSLSAVFTHAQQPYPASITQSQRQYMLYHNNVFFFSPYTVSSQETRVKLPSGNVEEYTQTPKPAIRQGDQIVYGPYSDRAPFSYTQLRAHFENNNNFASVTSLVRNIEVSHYGNINVEEHYEVVHTGAKLKGSFSRYDYQRSPYLNGISSVRVLHQTLPASAHDIYYRDEIGNISTSHVGASEKGIELDLLPRFPLFGGWRVTFYMGYDLPITEFLSTDANDGSHFILNMTFGKQMDNVAIDDLTIRVILPEGASNIVFHLPFPVDEESRDKIFTYLDTEGRPVAIVRKRNVVAPDHDVPFYVTYHFASRSLVREPLLLVVAFFSFFLFIMLAVRLDLSLGRRTSGLAGGRAERALEALQRLNEIFDERRGLHEQLDMSIERFGQVKNTTQIQRDRDAMSGGIERLRKETQKLANDLNEFDETIAARIRDADDLDARKTQIQAELIKLLLKKAPKEEVDAARVLLERDYADVDNELTQLIEEVNEKFR